MKRLLQLTVGPIASSGAASQTTIPTGGSVFCLSHYEKVAFIFECVGATGGTLDVYLQRKVGPNKWVDYCHLPQIVAGTTKRYESSQFDAATITDSGVGDDTPTATPAIAVNTIVPGHPGEVVRLVLVTGAGVSVAGSVTLYVQGNSNN